MSLDLPQLLPQVEQLGREAAARAVELNKKLEDALHAFDEAAATDPGELARKIEHAGERWRGARPTGEPLDSTYPAPDHPGTLCLMGADGSQIYPDRHSIAQFFLINIGSICFASGSGSLPEVASRPSLFFKEEDLFDEEDRLIDSLLVNGRRDLAEMRELARLAAACAGEPSVALLDNSLLLWLALQERERRRWQVERILAEYLEQIRAIQDAGVALAGFVDRPASVNVLALVHLAGISLESVDEQSLKTSLFRGLTDRQLFTRRLAPGHRSARFVGVSPLNRDFRERGHEIHFFYLNTGYQDQIARIEVPEWVAASPEYLAWVHAGIVEQCRITGIPYVLVRAHELAVVTQVDRAALGQMLASALVLHGQEPRISQKALTKKWTSFPRRHKL